MQNHGGFEGNAQTLRIIARLEKKHARPNTDNTTQFGLNLTLRSLAGILKYDTIIPETSATCVKGYYASEAPLVHAIKESILGVGGKVSAPFKTIECHIMDVADDIAYSTYDTEDAFKGGFLNPLAMLSAESKLLESIVAKLPNDMRMTTGDVQQILYEILSPHLQAQADADPLINAANIYQQAQSLCDDATRRTALTGQLVDEFVQHVKVDLNNDIPALSRAFLTEPAKQKVEILKHFSYEAVIQSRRLRIVAYRGAQIIKTIFGILSNEDNGGTCLLPNDVQNQYELATDQPARLRVVCDFIACMSDNYAIEFYSRLKSGNQQSIFKPF